MKKKASGKRWSKKLTDYVVNVVNEAMMERKKPRANVVAKNLRYAKEGDNYMFPSSSEWPTEDQGKLHM